MPQYSRIAAVTGANKGIGLAIIRNLALEYPRSPLNNGPLLIYLTSRDRTRGEDALKASRNDNTLSSVLSSGGGPVDLAYHQLDIADEASRKSFVEFLRKEHPEGIDVVVNNAGIAMNGFDNNVVDTTLNVNYHSAMATTRALLPLFKSSGGRFVNVSSMAGKLNKYPAALRTRFLDAASTGSVEDATALMAEFQAAVADGTHADKGWPGAAYAVSKAGLTAATKAVAREVHEGGGKVLVNACCPGYVATDMTKGGGSKTPDEGARTPVMLAVGEIGGKWGEFWQGEKVIEW